MFQDVIGRTATLVAAGFGLVSFRLARRGWTRCGPDSDAPQVAVADRPDILCPGGDRAGQDKGVRALTFGVGADGSERLVLVRSCRDIHIAWGDACVTVVVARERSRHDITRSVVTHDEVSGAVTEDGTESAEPVRRAPIVRSIIEADLEDLDQGHDHFVTRSSPAADPTVARRRRWELSRED